MIGGLTVAFLHFVNLIGLKLVWPYGWVNMTIASAIIAWYTADSLIARRTIYKLFGESEDTIKHELRLWRRVALLTSALTAVGSAMIALAPQAGKGNVIPALAAGPIAILTGAFLATLGWMYTRFEQEKSDRAAATLQAIREQLYGEYISKVYRQMRVMSDHYRTINGISDSEPLPIAAMETQLTDLQADRQPEGSKSTTLEYATDQFFNALNQLAFGVRQGQFDLRTIEMVMRPRFVRHAFLFFEYIKKETKAKEHPRLVRHRATKRTWEHFLWLTSKLDVLATDNIEFEYIVMPPDHIIGGKKTERAARPKKRRKKRVKRSLKETEYLEKTPAAEKRMSESAVSGTWGKKAIMLKISQTN
ncbi:MAG: hypothetical protein AAFO74_02255 [Pseudomonadota bacterium]